MPLSSLPMRGSCEPAPTVLATVWRYVCTSCRNTNSSTKTARWLQEHSDSPALIGLAPNQQALIRTLRRRTCCCIQQPVSARKGGQSLISYQAQSFAETTDALFTGQALDSAVLQLLPPPLDLGTTAADPRCFIFVYSVLTGVPYSLDSQVPRTWILQRPPSTYPE